MVRGVGVVDGVAANAQGDLSMGFGTFVDVPPSWLVDEDELDSVSAAAMLEDTGDQILVVWCACGGFGSRGALRSGTEAIFRRDSEMK